MMQSVVGASPSEGFEASTPRIEGFESCQVAVCGEHCQHIMDQDMPDVCDPNFPTALESSIIKWMHEDIDIQALIARLKDPGEDVVGDLRCCRMVRMARGDPVKAKKIFKEMLEFRVGNDGGQSDVEGIRAQVVGKSREDFLEWWDEHAYPHGAAPLHPCIGYTDNGEPFSIIRFGLFNVQKMADPKMPIHLRKCLIAFLEWLMYDLDKRSRAAGKMIYGLRLHDFQGIGEHGRGNPFVHKGFTKLLGTDLFAAHYADNERLIFAIDMPAVPHLMSSSALLFQGARQEEKLVNMGYVVDNPSWVEWTLTDHIGAKLLPCHLGGDLRDIRWIYEQGHA